MLRNTAPLAAYYYVSPVVDEGAARGGRRYPDEGNYRIACLASLRWKTHYQLRFPTTKKDPQVGYIRELSYLLTVRWTSRHQ